MGDIRKHLERGRETFSIYGLHNRAGIQYACPVGPRRLHRLVPPHAGVCDKGKAQLEHVVGVGVRRRERGPGAHPRPELARVLVLEHRHPGAGPEALHLLALLQREHGGQRALRRAAYVLVCRVVVAAVSRAPEALDVLAVCEGEARLAVRAPDLRERPLRARREALADLLLGGGHVPVGPLLEDSLARLLEDSARLCTLRAKLTLVLCAIRCPA